MVKLTSDFCGETGSAASNGAMSLLRRARHERGVYLNPVPTVVGATRHFPEILRKLLTGKEERVPRRTLGPFRTDASLYAARPASGLRITWLGHSSVLVEIDGTTLLVDPVFSRRASFVQWFGPERFYPPPLPLENLPRLDAVLLSHDHYDHLDAAAIPRLAERTPTFICSEGVGSQHLKRWGVPAGKIQELNWMDSYTVPAQSATPLRLTALPARHFSGRGVKRYVTLWSSFLLQTEKHNVYHGADSGYYAGFREIGERFGPFDLATLEIGAFDPLWAEIHLGPDNAVRAAADLRAKVLMPIHWGLFNLAFHAWYQPPERVTEVAQAAGLALWMPEPGLPAEFTDAELNTLWWRPYRSFQTGAEEASQAVVEVGMSGQPVD